MFVIEVWDTARGERCWVKEIPPDQITLTIWGKQATKYPTELDAKVALCYLPPVVRATATIVKVKE